MLPGEALASFSAVPCRVKHTVNEQLGSLPSGHTVVEASRKEITMNYLSKLGTLWKHLIEQERTGFAPMFDLPSEEPAVSWTLGKG